jgi:hypothetical protein
VAVTNLLVASGSQHVIVSVFANPGLFDTGAMMSLVDGALTERTLPRPTP